MDANDPEDCVNRTYATPWALYKCTQIRFLDPKQTQIPQVGKICMDMNFSLKLVDQLSFDVAPHIILADPNKSSCRKQSILTEPHCSKFKS